jgi:hypothetical protein
MQGGACLSGRAGQGESEGTWSFIGPDCEECCSSQSGRVARSRAPDREAHRMAPFIGPRADHRAQQRRLDLCGTSRVDSGQGK